MAIRRLKRRHRTPLGFLQSRRFAVRWRSVVLWIVLAWLQPGAFVALFFDWLFVYNEASIGVLKLVITCCYPSAFVALFYDELFVNDDAWMSVCGVRFACILFTDLLLCLHLMWVVTSFGVDWCWGCCVRNLRFFRLPVLAHQNHPTGLTAEPRNF